MKPIRECGGCRECCVLYAIPEFQKKIGEPCCHLNENGCAIHDQPRPEICTSFQCAWTLDKRFAEAARPDRSGIIFNRLFTENGKHIYGATMRSRYSHHLKRNVELLARLRRAGHIVALEWVGVLNGQPTIYSSYSYDEEMYPALTPKRIEAILKAGETPEEREHRRECIKMEVL